MEKMKALYEKVAKDASLRVKFDKIMEDAEKTGLEEEGKKLVTFAEEAGFDVTFDEIVAFFESLIDKREGELSETELDMVAGDKAKTIKVLVSIVTVGSGCAAGSIAYDDLDRKCKDFFKV